jgi:hypothetical protein
MTSSVPLEGSGTIRIIRRTIIQDLVRRYTVFIDDEPVGHLLAFQTGRYDVSAGPHRVRLAMPTTGTASSDDVLVDVPAGVVRSLRTRGRGLMSLLTLPIATAMAIRDRSRNQPFETRWYKRPWIILTPDEPSQ